MCPSISRRAGNFTPQPSPFWSFSIGILSSASADVAVVTVFACVIYFLKFHSYFLFSFRCGCVFSLCVQRHVLQGKSNSNHFRIFLVIKSEILRHYCFPHFSSFPLLCFAVCFPWSKHLHTSSAHIFLFVWSEIYCFQLSARSGRNNNKNRNINKDQRAGQHDSWTVRARPWDTRAFVFASAFAFASTSTSTSVYPYPCRRRCLCPYARKAPSTRWQHIEKEAHVSKIDKAKGYRCLLIMCNILNLSTRSPASSINNSSGSSRTSPRDLGVDGDQDGLAMRMGPPALTHNQSCRQNSFHFGCHYFAGPLFTSDVLCLGSCG